MDYDKLCSILLDEVFGNSPVNTLIEYPNIRPGFSDRWSSAVGFVLGRITDLVEEFLLLKNGLPDCQDFYGCCSLR